MLVRYDVPEDVVVEEVPLEDLSDGWRLDESVTKATGDGGLDSLSSALLRVPSVIVPVPSRFFWRRTCDTIGRPAAAPRPRPCPFSPAET